ncbi:MAG: MBL fold metallo-hydrolase [Myxococcota bacterium]
MRVHHLNCGTMCPPARLVGGTLVCHVLLLEHDDGGLILCDTGFGSADVAAPSRLGSSRRLLRPALVEAETAVAQVRRLGFSPRDVRHVLLTHLDLDHAGGLSDFPQATVHLMAEEYEAAVVAPAWRDRARYVAAQWAHGPKWRQHTPRDGESWEGFPRVRPVPGLNDEVALVPLPGHTPGHAGIAVRGETGWLLFAGDAYYQRDEVRADGAHRRAPWALALTQRFTTHDRDAWRRNLERLRDLATRRHEAVTVFPAHDAVSLRHLQRAAGRA